MGRVSMPEDNVASFLVVSVIANLGQGFDNLSAGNDGKFRHRVLQALRIWEAGWVRYVSSGSRHILPSLP